MENERYQSVDMDEIYYITDTQKLNKTYEDFLKDYEGEEFQEEHAKDDWREYLLENSMDGTEVVETLNRQDRVIDAQAEINESEEVVMMMSEKRFERWNDNSCKVKDNQEDTFLNWEDVVQKLNEQQDIIGEQKIAIDELITDYKKLEKENEQLIEENEQLRKQVKSSETTSDATSNYNAHLESKITTLEKENEQLRKQIQNYEQLISNSMSKKQCCLFEEESFDKYLTARLNEKEEIIKEQERRIIVLENLLTNIGVKWVDDDK